MRNRCPWSCARIAALLVLCVYPLELVPAQLHGEMLAQRGRGRRHHAPPPPQELPNLQTHLDIPYAQIQGVDPNRLSLDIYATPEAQHLPVLVFVHGGSWSEGDKSNVRRLPHPQFFCGEGFIYVAINHRLIPAVRHPENVRDVAAAVAWIHDNVAQYGGDPGRIFLMGHSSGGHLVALVATDHRRLAENDKDLSIIKGVIVNDCQAYDLARIIEQMPPAARLYPTVFGTDPQVLHDASPIKHVEPDKNIPPFLLMYSTLSGHGPIRARHASLMVGALRAAGFRARVVGIPNRTHDQVNEWLGCDGEVTTAEVMRFLQGELRRYREPAEVQQT